MERKPRKRARLGDVVEIRTPKGLAYAQFSHLHDRPPHYGPLLRVLPGLFDSRPGQVSDLVQQPERFFVFFPLQQALSRGLVSIVGNEDVPERIRAFPILRGPMVRDSLGKGRDWWLWDGEHEWRVGELTSEMRKMSLHQGWNDTLLIDRIASGWCPEDDS